MSSTPNICPVPARDPTGVSAGNGKTTATASSAERSTINLANCNISRSANLERAIIERSECEIADVMERFFVTQNERIAAGKGISAEGLQSQLSDFARDVSTILNKNSACLSPDSSIAELTAYLNKNGYLLASMIVPHQPNNGHLDFSLLKTTNKPESLNISNFDFSDLPIKRPESATVHEAMGWIGPRYAYDASQRFTRIEGQQSLGVTTKLSSGPEIAIFPDNIKIFAQQSGVTYEETKRGIVANELSSFISNPYWTKAESAGIGIKADGKILEPIQINEALSDLSTARNTNSFYPLYNVRLQSATIPNYAYTADLMHSVHSKVVTDPKNQEQLHQLIAAERDALEQFGVVRSVQGKSKDRVLLDQILANNRPENFGELSTWDLYLLMRGSPRIDAMVRDVALKVYSDQISENIRVLNTALAAQGIK